MAKWLAWLERLAGGGPGGKKRVGTLRWTLLIGLCGAALMIMHAFLNVEDANSIADMRLTTSPEPAAQEAFGDKNGGADMFEMFEARYEAEMKEILERIVGVGEVDIMVTIESTEALVVEKNVQQRQMVTDEKDRDGGTRHITDVTRNGEVVLYQTSGGQTPVVIKRIKPKIRGVLVVAGGADNAAVKLLVVQAVERGLDVPSHRISVVPRKQ